MVMTGDVMLPVHLKKIQPWIADFPQRRYTWLSNEEIASILVNFPKHAGWMTSTRMHRPENGRLLMFNRKKVKYRQDMYIWKTKRKSKWPREDHVKLKVESIPCIAAIYVHSDVLPTFHRRCYWFIQNPDVVLVHYLNYPYLDDDVHLNKDFSLNQQCQQWQDLTKQDILQQIQPMFSKMPWPRISDPPLTDRSMEIITNKLVEKHFETLRSQVYKKLTNRCNGQLRTIQPKPTDISTSSFSIYPSRHISTESTADNNPQLSNTNNTDANYTDVNSPLQTHLLHSGNTLIFLSQPTRQNEDFKQPTVAAACPGNALVSKPSEVSTPVAISFHQDVPAIQLENMSTGGSAMNENASNFFLPSFTTDVNLQSNSTYSESAANQTANDSSISKTEPNAHQYQQIIDQACLNQIQSTKCQPSQDITSGSLIESKSHNEMQNMLKNFNKNDNVSKLPMMSSLLPHVSNDVGNIKGNTSANFHNDPILTHSNLYYNYGMKDVMVPNCRNSLQPELSPFVDPTASSPSVLFDDFDVDCLFNTSTSIDSTSDQATSSTESAVDDFFPNQLFETGSSVFRVPQQLGLQSANSCLDNDLTETTDVCPALPCAPSDQMTPLDSITDYSPDWSYTEGGVKVLLTGTWTAHGEYTCLFNDISVPATPLQSGVLRCYCPAHSAGHVNLFIKRDRRIVSHSVKFEYKPVPGPYHDFKTRWLQLKEDEFKMSILERLERMEERLNSMGSNSGSTCCSGGKTLSGGLHNGHQALYQSITDKEKPSTSKAGLDYEERVSILCSQISLAFSQHTADCKILENGNEQDNFNSLTILHYATALGYSRLIEKLRYLSNASENQFLLTECNPCNTDRFGCTALTWACAIGQSTCVDILVEWNPLVLQSLDVLGRSPVAVAQLNGHLDIFSRLERSRANSTNNVQLLQDEIEDLESSSIGDTTISSVVDTADSGEDSMETDDNLSFESEFLPFAPNRARSSCFSIAPSNFDNELDNSQGAGSGSSISLPPFRPNWCRKENSLPQLFISDGFLQGDEPDSLAMLAEQIIEAVPDHIKEEGERHEEEDLTLRSLPFYVNSRCGATSFQPYSIGENLFHRDVPVVSRMNWRDFLQLPPRQVTDARYQSPSDFEFDSLRLTELEQRELYRAGRTILNSYYHHEDLPLPGDVVKASMFIQRCYRKYRKFALSKKMNEAAVLIQSKFRSYQEQKRFQKSRHAAILIQSFYRSYKYTRAGERTSKRAVRLIEDALRGHMSKKTQHQAARKIQRFLRRCQHRYSTGIAFCFGPWPKCFCCLKSKI
ncbi:unnamed protein product [Clavelina lepadiformis]|uniref:CG-1 domain-containing protein n=1 Tax=Clavelina lepadiformis TaxID=159417 RepID=A0ABP0FE59_CLALP